MTYDVKNQVKICGEIDGGNELGETTTMPRAYGGIDGGNEFGDDSAAYRLKQISQRAKDSLYGKRTLDISEQVKPKVRPCGLVKTIMTEDSVKFLPSEGIGGEISGGPEFA